MPILPIVLEQSARWYSFAGPIAGILLLVVTVGFFGWMYTSGDWTPDERKRLYVIGVLFLAAALFWSVFEQAGSSLNLFTDRHVDRGGVPTTYTYHPAPGPSSSPLIAAPDRAVLHVTATTADGRPARRAT